MGSWTWTATTTRRASKPVEPGGGYRQTAGWHLMVPTEEWRAVVWTITWIDPGVWKSVMAPSVVLSGCAGRSGFCQPKSNQLRPASSQHSPTSVSGSLRPVRGGIRFTLREGSGQFPPRTDLPRGDPLPYRLPPGCSLHPVFQPRMPPRVDLPSVWVRS